MREGFRSAPLVDQRDQILDLLGHAVEIGHLVVHADEAALGAGAVVAGDVDEQRVVHLTDVLECLLEAADLAVGLLQESREHFGLTSEQTPFGRGQRIPRLDVVRPGGQLRVGRNHAELLLPFERFGADRVPALVVLSLVLVGPLLRHVVRRMRRAGREVDEERLVRRHRLLRLHPVDRLVGHVDGEVVVGHLRRIDLDDAVVDERKPLVGFTADEPVELVEALMRGPAIERAGHARLPRGGFVPLAERAGAVAVEAQHLRQRRDAVRILPRVAGEGRRALHDRARIHGVVVPSGLQRVARRRAERRRVEVVEAQARRCASRSIVGVRIGPPNVLGPPKPTSSIRTMTTFGAFAGALTSNRAGGFALRASSSLYRGGSGSAIGRTVRSSSRRTWQPAWLSARAPERCSRPRLRWSARWQEQCECLVSS